MKRRHKIIDNPDNFPEDRVMAVTAGHRDFYLARQEEEIACLDIKCPVITTFKAKGLISNSHPLAGGVPDRSGTPMWRSSQTQNFCGLC
jgi:thiamine pyrophosphate-dependent acetolactate synthase large subunit-like protein